MKLLHTADWHLGRMLYGRSFLEDQAHFIRQFFLPLVREELPDAVIIAGDVFDRQIAPVEAIALLEEAIDGVVEALGIPMLFIAGNHDGAERLALSSKLLRKSGLYIASDLTDAKQPVVLGGGQEETHVYLLPYFDPPQARAAGYPQAQGWQEAYAAVVGSIAAGLDKRVRNVLVSHCFAAGGVPSNSETSLSAGGAGQVETGVFEAFDYVALGHLHAAQRAGNTGRYAGSPLKYSFDEEKHHKSVTMVEWREGELHVALREVQPLRDMRVIEEPFETLAARDTPCEDYVYLRLADRAPVFEPVARLRGLFPNLLGLSGEWMDAETRGTPGRSLLRAQVKAQKAGDLALFDAFMREACGQTPEDQDRALFREAYLRAGEEEERL